MSRFVVEDEIHADLHGEYESLEEALEVLKKRSELAWDDVPNRCPCSSWMTCGREYLIQEYDCSTSPHWKLLRSIPVLSVSRTGITWKYDVEG